MKKWWTKIEDKAEELGIATQGSFDGDDWDFSFFSPTGQDFHIELNAATKKELVKELSGYIDRFDVSEETYLRLDNFGHGKNGAPYDMRNVYNDMEWCLNKAKQLLDALK